MLPAELIKKIRTIEIKSNKLVEEVFSGQYHSCFKGNGLEFQDIREYSAGDDIRMIDWNVTARQNRMSIKQFREERELNLFLLVDCSNSIAFGRKRELITEIAATLAFSAVKNNDKVGCILFTDKVEKFVLSDKGKKHALSIISSIISIKPESTQTDIKKVLNYFGRYEKKRSVVFVISDFLDTNFERDIAVLSLKHDVILIRILEQAEKTIPQGAIFSFRDMETGEEVVIDNLKGPREMLTSLKFNNMITIDTNQDFVKPLLLFFKKRKLR